MSSELDRLLQEARGALPAPDEPSTEHARRRALATLRRRRTRPRVLVLGGAMVVTAILLGITAGSLNAPGVTAAREPAVLGFVPEPGWFALQSPPPAIEGQQTAAVAANVPFAADDVENGLVEPSGLPYSTLLSLPPNGIVIVMTMVPQSEPHVAPVPTNPLYEERELPLRLRDGVPLLLWGAQVRPDQPLAQYQLRANLAKQNVDVIVYFGTSRPSAAQMRAAQRQLAGLVVQSAGAGSTNRPAAPVHATSSFVVIDRTFTCDAVQLGGLYRVEARGHAGNRVAGEWSRLAYAGVATGGNAGRVDSNTPPGNTLAWISAGAPSARTTIDDSYNAFSARVGGTIGRNTELCRPTTARVALSRAGLRGGALGVQTRTFDCDVPKRVHIRVRATARGDGALRERGRIFLATSDPVVRAELAIRAPSGQLLAYATVDQSGRSQQYTSSKGCARDS